MKHRNKVVTLFLIAALVALQAGVLDRMEEKIAEDRLTRVSDIPVSSALPTYLSSLFLGSFRMVVANFYWIQLKNLREEHRLFEAQQVMEMITWMQPHNPEVWSLLAWDASYNIPEGSTYDPRTRWKLIRYGLGKYHEGALNTPASPTLKFELSFRLWHRMHMSRRAFLDMDLIERIEKDDELQRKLQSLPPGKPLEKRLSPFQLSIEWLNKTRDQINHQREKMRYGFSYFVTQMGLILHPDTMDGYIRENYFFEGLLRWKRGEREAAKVAFSAAAEQARHIWKTYGAGGKMRVSPINLSLAEFYDRLPPIVDLDHQYRTAPPGERKDELLRKFHHQLTEVVEITQGGDDGHLTSLLAPVRRKLLQKDPGIQEPGEFNDFPPLAAPLAEKTPLTAVIGPLRGDRDYYQCGVHGLMDPRTKCPLPFRETTLRFAIKNRGDLPLRISTVETRKQRPAEAVSIPPEARKEFALTVLGPGVYVLLVEAEIAEEDRFQGASGDLYDLVWEETDRSGPIVPEEAPHVHSNCGH